MNILPLVFVDVYARKHSSRHKVERLVYYSLDMWQCDPTAKYSSRKLSVWTKAEGEREREKELGKNTMRSRVIDIIEYVVF